MTGTAGENGWYRSPVEARWTLFDPESPVTPTAGCQPTKVDRETAGERIECSAESAGGSSSSSKVLRTDWTPPAVAGASADRAPDHAGWYNRPVVVTFSGSDALSGLAGCTAMTYSAPDGEAASVPGTCADLAGNTSAPAPFTFRFDATPPGLDGVAARPGDAQAEIVWRAAPDALVVEVARAPGVDGAASSIVYRGPRRSFRDRRLRHGVRYQYTVSAADAAGNATARNVTAVPGRRLLSPAAGARVSKPPVLRWTPLRGARYYNVQLFRGGRKLYSAWPTRAELRLRASWRFGGRRHRLVPGRYQWFVWPGIGPRRAARYGARLDGRTFVVTRG